MSGWGQHGPYGAKGMMPAGTQQEIGASLAMQQFADLWRMPGVVAAAYPVMHPHPLVPVGPGVARRARRRVHTEAGTTAGTLFTAPFKMDTPSIVYALTAAAAYDTGEATNPNSLDSNPLNWFTIDFKHNQGDKIDSASGLGSALVGTGERPAPVGGEGWTFRNGGTLTADVTPRYSNLTITIAVWLIEIIAGSSSC